MAALSDWETCGFCRIIAGQAEAGVIRARIVSHGAGGSAIIGS